MTERRKLERRQWQSNHRSTYPQRGPERRQSQRKPPKATLYELPKNTLQDIPGVLRAIADQMESGQYGETDMGALVVQETNGNIRTFGMGGADYYRALAMFQMGIENLIAKRGREYML